MGGKGRNILQPPCGSLASGLWRNSIQPPLPVRLMRTPYLVPTPHSLCHWANWHVWQLQPEHHSCSPSIPRLWSVHRCAFAELSRIEDGMTWSLQLLDKMT